MIFSKGTVRNGPDFYYNKTPITTVSSYKYLGLILSSNGKFKNAVEDRIQKGKRALYLLKQALSNDTGNISVSLALSLFDKQIAPTLLYGCSIWAMPSNFRSVSLQNVPENIPLSPFLENLCNRMLNKTLNIINCQRMERIHDKAPRKVLINLTTTLMQLILKK